MKKFLILLVFIALAGGFWFAQQRTSDKAKAKPETANTKETEPAHAESEGILKVEAAKQKQAGITTQSLATTNTPETWKAWGKVADPSPLFAMIAEIAASNASQQASFSELARLKLLHGQNQNISVRALETAEAASRRDEALLHAAHTRLIGTWGHGLAERADLHELAEKLSHQKASIIRLDMPLNQASEKMPEQLDLLPLGQDSKALTAKVSGLDPVADTRTMGTGVFCILEENWLPVGAPVTGIFAKEGSRSEKIIIPEDAVVRHEGQAFIYEMVAEEQFKRRPISLDQRGNNGWLVHPEDLKVGAKIVVTGAQILLSEELMKGAPAD